MKSKTHKGKKDVKDIFSHRRTQPVHNSLQCKQLHQELVNRLTGIPSGYGFAKQYLLSSVLSKYADPSPASAEARKRAAYDKLLATELRNRETEWRLRNSQHVGRRSQSYYFSLISAEIYSVLGGFNVTEFHANCDFSGGAGYNIPRGRESQPINKFIAEAGCSEKAIHLLPDLSVEPYVLPPLNQLFTVPKNDKIDRCACKEPAWNMFMQKSCGNMIRRRLKRCNIDLNDQSVNRDLARKGSIDGSLATLDLSAASDSITSELVYRLLPADWFYVLDSLRAVGANIDGKFHKWSLFSTMGNGFTFELESLLFYAIARVASRLSGTKVVSIYGDDIIVETNAVDLTVELLQYCGFALNMDKSFWTGKFRESCGGHYYAGWDITPFYIKRPITTIYDACLFLNSFRVWLCRTGGGELSHLWNEMYEILYTHFLDIGITLDLFLCSRSMGSPRDIVDDFIYHPNASVSSLSAYRRVRFCRLHENPLGLYYWLYKTANRTEQTHDRVPNWQAHYKPQVAFSPTEYFPLQGKIRKKGRVIQADGVRQISGDRCVRWAFSHEHYA